MRIKTTSSGDYALKFNDREVIITAAEYDDLCSEITSTDKKRNIEGCIRQYLESDCDGKYDVNAILADKSLMTDLIAYYEDVEYDLIHVHGIKYTDAYDIMLQVEERFDTELAKHLSPDYDPDCDYDRDND